MALLALTKNHTVAASIASISKNSTTVHNYTKTSSLAVATIGWSKNGTTISAISKNQ